MSKSVIDKPTSPSELLKRYQDDPILPLELSEILPKLRSKDASVEHIKRFYRRDPILCAYLIDLAWQATKKRANHPFDADLAMSTIGIQGANQFLADVPDGDRTELSDEVKFILSSSLLAAELAKNIAKASSHKTKSNQLYWGALAHQFPDTLLWHLCPKPMWRIHYKQTQNSLSIKEYETKQLGFTRDEWRQTVAKQWHMSELNQTTFTKAPPNNSRDLIGYANQGFQKQFSSLKEWQNTDAFLILTVNWLAKSLIAPWLSNRYQHYFKIVQKAYSIKDKNLKNAISESIRQTSYNTKNSRLFVPASCYLYLQQPAIYPKWLNEKSDIQKVNTKSVTDEQGQPFDIKALLNKLINTPEKFKNSAELLTQSFAAITNGIGFSRVSFMSINWNNKRVITKMAFCKSGSNLQKIKPDFEFAKPTPLQNFLDKQGFLIFDINKHQKIWSKLPIAIKQQKVQQFALYSIKPNNRVKALIYVDGREILFTNPNKVKQLKIILNAVNQALGGSTTSSATTTANTKNNNRKAS